MAPIEKRIWSEEEVADMKNYIIERDPDLWRRMQEIEKGYGDYRGKAEYGAISRQINNRHPTVPYYERDDLFWQLRMQTQRDLKLI